MLNSQTFSQARERRCDYDDVNIKLHRLFCECQRARVIRCRSPALTRVIVESSILIAALTALLLELLFENNLYVPQFRKFSYFSFAGFIATPNLAGLRLLLFVHVDIRVYLAIKRTNLEDGPIQFRHIYFDENITVPSRMTDKGPRLIN